MENYWPLTNIMLETLLNDRISSERRPPCPSSAKSYRNPTFMGIRQLPRWFKYALGSEL